VRAGAPQVERLAAHASFCGYPNTRLNPYPAHVHSRAATCATPYLVSHVDFKKEALSDI
jgi:hypothetical protein